MSDEQHVELPPPQIEIGTIQGHKAIALRLTIALTPEVAKFIADQLEAVTRQAETGIILPHINVDLNGGEEGR